MFESLTLRILELARDTMFRASYCYNFEMDDARLHKRIAETQTEIFPLDRFLPLDSVYTIFHIEYEKEDSKTVFLNNRVYSRLR